MALLDDFYNIKCESIKGLTARFDIVFNRFHPIYAAHFPDHPVTPGVCLIHICKELTERMLGETLFMQTLKNVKFMKKVDPDKTPCVRVQLSIVESGSGYRVGAEILDESEVIYAKLNLVFNR